MGYCLYKLGCKGPETYNNCSTLRFNDMGTWPVNTGHPCFGCSEEGVGFNIPLHTPAEVQNVTPAAVQTPINVDHGGGAGAAAVALAAGVAGAAIGAGAVAVKKVGQEEKKQD